MSHVHSGSKGGAVLLALLLPVAAVGACDTTPATPNAAAQTAAATDPPANATAAEPGKRKVALLVGISRYSPTGGWSTLSTGPDLERIRAALEIQGFAAADIHTLTDGDADREGIEAAFRRHLIAGAGQGGVAVFHYSGHGQRITDDDHDEVDGYDEALVPFDAPMKLEGYDGGKHLRDDDLGDWLGELRRAIGAGGDVLVSLDSCFSGAATRGLGARGSLQPLGPPQPPLAGELGHDSESGFVDGAARGVTVGGGGELSPYAVISAARHDELAFETRDEQGRSIGSLSLALGTALTDAGAETTYRDLYDKIRRIMANHVRNRPQLEGKPNRHVLNGKAEAQQEFYRLASYDPATRTAVVQGGALVGLLQGSRVALHPPATRDPSGTPLASGEVTRSRSLTSEATFDTVAEGAAVEEGWLFVTEPAFGDVRVKTYVGAGAWRSELLERLAARKLIVPVDAREASDVAIEEGADGVEVYQTVDDNLLLGPLAAAEPRFAVQVRQALEDFARNRWLRRIEARSRDVRVTFALRPCRLETTESALGDEVTACGGDLERRTAAGALELQVGDGFAMDLVNRGAKDAYVVVLDLMPDGRIGLLYPGEDQMGSDNLLAAGRSFTIPDPYRIGPPLGNEMLKLFATLDPVDFRPILSGRFNPGASRGLLDRFMEGAFDGTRANPTVSTGPVATESLTFTVSNPGEEGDG